jgi:hypothetical protein
MTWMTPLDAATSGRGHARVGDEHLAAAHAHADALAVERLDRRALDDLGGGELALGDVVEQHGPQLRLVGSERVQRLLGHLGERGIGRREHRVRPLALQRLGQPRPLQQRRQGVELTGRPGRLDDVLARRGRAHGMRGGRAGGAERNGGGGGRDQDRADSSHGEILSARYGLYRIRTSAVEVAHRTAS